VRANPRHAGSGVCEVCTVAAYALNPAALALAEARAAATAEAGGPTAAPRRASRVRRIVIAQPPPPEPVVDWACCEGAVYNDKSFAKLACAMGTIFAALLIAAAVFGTGAVRMDSLKAD
jgi:hypothetical protein